MNGGSLNIIDTLTDDTALRRVGRHEDTTPITQHLHEGGEFCDNMATEG